jgi:hypothetical protein
MKTNSNSTLNDLYFETVASSFLALVTMAVLSKADVLAKTKVESVGLVKNLNCWGSKVEDVGCWNSMFDQLFVAIIIFCFANLISSIDIHPGANEER